VTQRGSTQTASATVATATTTAGQIRFVSTAISNGNSDATATYGVNAISCTVGKPLSSPNARAAAQTTNGTAISHTSTVSHRRRGRGRSNGGSGRVSSVLTIPPA
jgi:hypothetical protein